MSETEEPNVEEFHGVIESCQDKGNFLIECLIPPIGEGIGATGYVTDSLLGLGALVSMLALVLVLLVAFAAALSGVALTAIIGFSTGLRSLFDHQQARAHIRDGAKDIYWMSTWTITASAGLYVLFIVLGFLLAGLLGVFAITTRAGDQALRDEFRHNILETLTNHNPVMLLQADSPNPGGVAFWVCVITLTVFGGLHWYGTERGLEKPDRVPDLLSRVTIGGEQ